MSITRKREIRTLSHSFYDCQYHIVWTPKYRGKILGDGYVKKEIERMLRMVCKWKKWEVLEINVQEDHIHLCLEVMPKYSISYVMQVVKGKSSAWIKKKNKRLRGLCQKGSLWARGYFVSTIGMDERIIRRYVKYQSNHNQVEQPRLFEDMEHA